MVSGYEERFRRPRSLAPEQLTDLPVTRAEHPIAVRAWIVWESGVEELIDAHADAWTRRAVHVSWRPGPRIRHEAWVWAGAVERLTS